MIDVQVQRLDDKTVIVDLLGDVNAFAESSIAAAYNQITDQGFNNIIFNFQQGDIIATQGMAVLVNVVAQAYRRHQTLCMAIPDLHFRRIFSLIGVTQYAQVVDSLEAAKRQLA